MYIHILLATLFTLLPLHTCACTSPCATCSPTDPTYCLSCSGALSLVSLGLCNCPPGQYPLLALLTCLPCDSSCATCTGLVGTTCTGCASNKILYNGKCYAQCPDGKYFDTSTLTCKVCDPSCQTCSAAGSTSCTSCNTGTGTVVNNGKCTCPSGQYKDSSTNTCKPCYSTCKECNGPLATDCTSCAVSGLMLQSNGECKCSAGTYLNTSPVSCLACDPSCQSCTGSAPNQCSSCKNNLVFSSGSCICGSGTYYDSSLVACMACDSTCGGCTGSASNQCTSCKNNLELSSGSCTCPDGTFYDSSSLTCVNCDSSCKTCSGSAAYQCTSCEATYTLVSGQCKCSSGCTCPSGTYFDSASLTCSPCHYSCAECSGPASNQCTSCDSDQYLSSSGTCLCASSSSCNCGSGTYFDSTALACSSCDPTCATCTGPNSGQCLSCANNLIFSSGQCTCPAGNYLHPTQHVCLQCHSSCASCTGPYANQCTACNNNMLLLSNNICGCSSGNYADYGSLTCNVCDPNCKECSGPESSQCTDCFTPKVLENNYCLDACAAHQYRSYDGSCQECDSSCKECNGPTSIECTSCFPTSFLQMNQCIPTGCYQGCRTCQGVLINECLTCMDGYAFYDNNNGLGTCTTQCPSYSYLVISNGILICRDKVEIDNAISYSGGFNQVIITFNRDIESDLETILDNIKISIVFRSEQPPISFSVSYSMTDDKQGIIIELSFKGHLLPGNILNVEYGQFITNSTINYYMTNDLQQVSLMEAYQYSDSAQQAINTTSAINTAASQANKVYSWASAFVLRSVHSMRSQIVEDMLECFIYMNVDFPPNFVQYASDNGDSLDNLVPNFGDFILDKMGANFRLLQQHDSGDNVLGSNNAIDTYLQDKAFLVNFGSELTMIFIALLVLIVVEIFKCILKKYKGSKQNKVLAFFERACIYSSYALRWNFMLSQFISVYTQLTLFSLIEVANIRELITPIDYLKYISGVIALFLAVVCLIGVFLLIRRVYIILNQKYKSNQKVNPEKEADFLERFSLFHKTFNASKRGQQLYPFLLITRSFGFALVIVFLQRVPWAQILYITISTVILLALLIILKPFRSRIEQILTVIYELLFLTACTVTIALHAYNQNHLADIDGRSNLGFVICACSLLMILLNLINCPLELWEVKKQLKAYKQKSKVSPANTTAAQTLKAKIAQISPETSPINAKRSKSLVVQAQTPESTPKPKKPLLIPLNTIHEEENSKNENISATLKKDKKAEAWKIHVRTVLDKKIDEIKLEEEPEDKPAKSNPTRASTLLAPKSTEVESKNLNQPETESLRRKRDFTLASLRALRSSSKLFSSTLEELDVLKPSSGDEEHLKPISPSFSRKRFLSRGTLLSPKDRQSPPVSKAESDPSSGSPDSQEVLPKSPKDLISSEEEDNKLESSSRLSPQLRLSELMLRRSMESRPSFDFDSSRVGLMKSPTGSISIDGSLLETYFERKHKLRMPRGQRETLTSIYIRNASAASSGLLSPQSNSKEA